MVAQILSYRVPQEYIAEYFDSHPAAAPCCLKRCLQVHFNNSSAREAHSCSPYRQSYIC